MRFLSLLVVLAVLAVAFTAPVDESNSFRDYINQLEAEENQTHPEKRDANKKKQLKLHTLRPHTNNTVVEKRTLMNIKFPMLHLLIILAMNLMKVSLQQLAHK